jgi:hypothetical protein
MAGVRPRSVAEWDIIPVRGKPWRTLPGKPPKCNGVGYRRLVSTSSTQREGRDSPTKRIKPKATKKAHLTVRIQPPVPLALPLLRGALCGVRVHAVFLIFL